MLKFPNKNILYIIKIKNVIVISYDEYPNILESKIVNYHIKLQKTKLTYS